jgi:hypothetical protein
MSGTGFFVLQGEKHLFLVTAGHVAKIATADWSATICLPDDRPFSFLLSQLVSGGAVNWVTSDNADIAVLVLHPDSSIVHNLAHHFISIDLLTKALAAPGRQTPLTAMGFPLSLGIGDRFSPLTREAKCASGLLTLGDPELGGKLATFFVLDAPSIEGFSGSPVFTWPLISMEGGGLTLGTKFAVVGLFKGTLSDGTGGKLGVVIPSSYIVETIAKAALETH